MYLRIAPTVNLSKIVGALCFAVMNGDDVLPQRMICLTSATVMPTGCATRRYGQFTLMNVLPRDFSFLNNVARRTMNAVLHSKGKWSNMRDMVECCNSFDTWRVLEFRFTSVYRFRGRGVMWRDFGGWRETCGGMMFRQYNWSL